MMQVPTLPGFQDPVHDAQSTFRGLLQALAYPGQQERIAVQVSAPDPLMPACAAAALTLMDDRTQVWMPPEEKLEIRTWLQFHTGCRWSDRPQQADFAVVCDTTALPRLREFAQGTPEEPEASTTLLIQTKGFHGGTEFMLSGPGISEQQTVWLDLGSPTLIEDLQCNSWQYPQGVDIFLFSDQQIMAIPRSVICEAI